MRALVAGGFRGSHIVEALLARGDQVCVLDNLDPRVHGPETPSLSHEVDFIQDDLSSYRVSLREALKEQLAVIFHGAAMVGLGKGAVDAESYVSVNVIGTIRLMDAKSLAPGPEPEFPGLYRSGDMGHIYGSISEIRGLGLSPRILFKAGVARFAAEPTQMSARGFPS